MERTGANSCKPLREYDLTQVFFRESHSFSITFIKSSYTEFHENPTKGLVVDTRPESGE
jgi:hypothetical protein